MRDETPPDPFAEDPEDPASLLGDDDDARLTDDERASVESDLQDVEMFRALLEPQGVRGLAMACAECNEEHYFGWDLLGGNLRQMIGDGRPGVHEPAYAPDPTHYVSWDYARGYLDGVLDAVEDDEA